jgi:hypothetical protein
VSSGGETGSAEGKVIPRSARDDDVTALTDHGARAR